MQGQPQSGHSWYTRASHAASCPSHRPPQNNDGVVDLKEICAGLKAIGVEGSDEEMLVLATGFDSNSSGTIELPVLKE